MKTPFFRIFARCVAVGGLAAFVAAAAPALDPAATRIDDPRVLASLGFSKDAIVYRAPTRRTAAPESPDAFGTVAASFSSYLGNELQGRDGSYSWGSFDGAGDVYFNAGSDFGEVRLDLPNGAKLEAVRWWGRDTEAAKDLELAVIETCLPDASAGTPVSTILDSQTSTGSSGDQSDQMTFSYTVDTRRCSYRVRVHWYDVLEAIRLYKIRAQWKLQVSPAPGVATFGDVPTSHLYFKAIEALAASGITSGCGAGNFCPDQPVTRGELAKFLANALGLHWP
jgi:hypothetical protein